MLVTRKTSRLAQAATAAGRTYANDRRRRETVRLVLAICTRVRHGLDSAGIDPGRAPALLRVCRQYEAELAALGDVPDLPLLDESPEDAVADFAAAEKVDAKIQALVQYFRHRPAIDFADSSLAELYAWCIAQQGRQPGDPL